MLDLWDEIVNWIHIGEHDMLNLHGEFEGPKNGSDHDGFYT